MTDTIRLQNIALAYQQSAALFAAIELDLFSAIAQGADSIDAIAGKLDLARHQVDRLVTVLTAMQLLVKNGDRYGNAADVERFLVKGSPRYAGAWMLFTKPQWNDWGQLADKLRVKQEKRLGMYEEFSVEDARAYHAATNSIGMGAARRFLKQVDLTGRRRLLDLGGGSGAYSIEAAKAYPDLRAIVFDLPPVAVVAREYIARHGVADRVTAMAGDFTADDFPAGVDVAVMASNLPQYSAELIQLVIAKAYAALAPSGEMHLVGEALNDDRSGPLNPALWGLAEALSGSTGVAHSEAECKTFFAKAGFVDIAVHEFVPGILSRITGRKPA
jgi:SAM-dependent methyltransferase